HKTTVTLFAARLAHIRQRLAADSKAVSKLGDLFTARAAAAVDLVNNQFGPFEAKLRELEKTVDSLLAEGSGPVSVLLSRYRGELRAAAAAALQQADAAVEGVLQQVAASSQQVDLLLQLAEEGRACTAAELSRSREVLGESLQLFKLLARQQLLLLSQQQQQSALQEAESFVEKLQDMHLKEHVLQTTVDRFSREIEDYKRRKKLKRGPSPSAAFWST
ncbi:microtubule-binding protein, putative, partial [Eimeria tenella]